MNSLKDIVARSGMSKKHISESLGLTRAGFYKWLDKGFDLEANKLHRLGEIIGYDFSEHLNSKTPIDIENLSQAELIQQVSEKRREIESLKGRIKSIEIQLIRQYLK